jgi:hypothetical protein
VEPAGLSARNRTHNLTSCGVRHFRSALARSIDVTIATPPPGWRFRASHPPLQGGMDDHFFVLPGSFTASKVWNSTL